MMKFLIRKKYLIFILFGNLQSNLYLSQNNKADSLFTTFFNIKSVDKKLSKLPELLQALYVKDDSIKIIDLISNVENITASSDLSNLKQGLLLYSKALLFDIENNIDKSIEANKESVFYLKNNKKYLTISECLLIKSLYFNGQFDSCIALGNQALENAKINKNISGELDVLICVGRSYDFIGNREKAIKISFQAVDLAKKQNKALKLSEIYISLSNIYKGENIVSSKKYAILALNVLKEAHLDKKNKVIDASYLMLGNVYYDLKNLDSAMYYYNLCKESSKETNNKRTYLSAIGNMGNIAYNQKEYTKAISYNLETLFEYKKLNIKTEIAVAYGSLADIYKDIKDYKKAIKYYDSALIVTTQLQSADDFIYNYKGLSETYEMMGNSADALKYYKLYRMWNDSVNNNQNSKKINELELDYKYKAEQREKDLIQKNKDDVIQEKIKQQKYIIWVGVLGGLVLFIFLGFAVKSNIDKKKTNKQLQLFNNEITEQKNIIETKNHEITDSITYASRIQQGVIPDEDELKELLPHHFVFFKPRDIVSGDFYWACKVKSKTDPNLKRSVVAVVDCTGHGVPGAFMSLVGNTLLNQTINRSAISNPAQALDYINHQLPKTIKSKSSTGAIKDGMEIAMCDFNFDTLTMQFAGANSNIYVVRNKEIQIYKGDKQPIGESLSGTIINYTNQIIALQKNDCVYLISDGYADQFGGVKGKKFKYKQLENLFCAIAEKEVNEQQHILSNAFDEWKSNHEQVDDVLIMGIKM